MGFWKGSCDFRFEIGIAGAGFLRAPLRSQGICGNFAGRKAHIFSLENRYIKGRNSLMNKPLPMPWDFLAGYRNSFFSGEWPSLPELFRITAHRFPDRNCFTIFEPGRRTLSYAQALEEISHTARYLLSIGIASGDRVAVSGSNTPEWTVAYLAVLFTGAVVVPIDYQLKNEETANLLRASGAKALFIDEEKLDFFERNPGALTKIISLAKGRGLFIGALPEAGPGFPLSAHPSRETDMAAILYTSGTTGNPKGVVLTHRNLVVDCYIAQGYMTIYPTDVFYALLPLHHAYCMLAVFIETISVGAELVFGKRLVVKQMLHDFKAAGVTMFLGVPLLFNKVLAAILRGVREKGLAAYMLVRLLMGASGLVKKLTGLNPGKKIFRSVLDRASLASLRICISGGGPLAPSVFRAYNQLGIDFVQGYGLTETSPILTLNPVEHYKVTSVGKVLSLLDMKIIGADGSGNGEIAAKGPVVMAGYYNMPEETAAVFTEDGYFKTGDVGYLDSQNYLYLTGRAKNLIVTEGGKNVYPEELENAFQLFDEIEQILIRGYTNPQNPQTELIEALVYPNREICAGTAEETEKLIRRRVDAVNRQLLPYQRISRIRVLGEAMEMTTSKKIKRHSLII
jgi:long-chain acyl-CoA synthetase